MGTHRYSSFGSARWSQWRFSASVGALQGCLRCSSDPRRRLLCPRLSLHCGPVVRYSPATTQKQSESINNMDRMVAIKQYLWRAGHMEINIIERPGSTTRRVGFRVGELCNVQGMQSVHIFLLTDAIEDCMLINMRRKGKLD